MYKNPKLVKAMMAIHAEKMCKFALLELHNRILNGTDHEEAFDNLCETANDYYNMMTEASKMRTWKLSEDLYKLSDEINLQRFDPCI